MFWFQKMLLEYSGVLQHSISLGHWLTPGVHLIFVQTSLPLHGKNFKLLPEKAIIF